MDRDESPDTARSCPPIGLRRSGVRFRLYTKSGAPDAPTAGSADPLVRQFTGVSSARSYLAAVDAAGRTLIPYVTLLIEPNEYPGGARGTVSQPGATNDQVEKVWAEAFRSLRSAPIPGIASLENRTIATDAPDGPPRTGPLAFCRKMEETIEPLCPGCLGRLSVCRDEALLRTSGLAAYGSTLSRYLYCATCSRESGWSPTFYTYSLRDADNPASGVRVRRRSELYRDLATAVQVGTGDPEGEHFCFECPNRTVCYPAGRSVDSAVPAEDLLVPLAYYENLYLPVESLPLDFSETAALLGGAAPSDLASSTPSWGDLQKEETLEHLARKGVQFFFEGDGSGLFALEVLNLKLSAFSRLVGGLRDLAIRNGRPHLALSPDRVRGGLSEDGSALPVRWGLSLAASDLVTTARLDLFEPIAGEPQVWSIPYPLPEPYVPDGLTRIQSEALFMRLTVKDLKLETTPSGSRVRIVADLVADDYRDSDHGRHDLVRLSADQVPGFEGRLVLSGRKIGAIPRGFVFEGTSATLSDDLARAFDPKRPPASWSVETTIVHTFGAPADVMSLGVLLLKLLLTNDRQDASGLNREGAGRIAAGLTSAGGEGGTARYAAVFGKESLKSGPEQVLFRESDRNLAPAAIPAMLWEETLDLGLRMASNIPGWSVCAAQDDYDLDRLARAFDRVLEDLDMLSERARGGLIGSSGRNGVVIEVCDDFLEDFRDAVKRGPAVGEPDAPQMTVVVAPPRRGS